VITGLPGVYWMTSLLGRTLIRIEMTIAMTGDNAPTIEKPPQANSPVSLRISLPNPSTAIRMNLHEMVAGTMIDILTGTTTGMTMMTGMTTGTTIGTIRAIKTKSTNTTKTIKATKVRTINTKAKIKSPPRNPVNLTA
jgi:hypothetical protein